MDEQALALLQQMVVNQQKELEYLKNISDDMYAVHGAQESICIALQDWYTEVQEQNKAAQELAEKEKAEQEAALLAEAEQVPEYQESLEKIQASASDMQMKLDNINKSFSELDIGIYQESFIGLTEETKEMGTTAQQTNSFLVVIGLGVFLVIGILLAPLVFRKM